MAFASAIVATEGLEVTSLLSDSEKKRSITGNLFLEPLQAFFLTAEDDTILAEKKSLRATNMTRVTLRKSGM